MGKLETKIATDIVYGISNGCIEANCALIGGETAEMPGFYKENEYDLAGFAVGVVDNKKIIDGSEISVGNKLIGIASNGLHSNGYSLVRKICFDLLKLKIDDYVDELGKTIGEEIITPTKIYSNVIKGLIKNNSVHGLAHITGGGIAENIVRIMPETCKVLIYKNSWEVPEIFNFIQNAGSISDAEMVRTFNNGIGLVAVVGETDTQEILERMNAINEKAFLIGEVAKRKPSGAKIEWV
jgi:phosphoribosylformylglycinamidine cyclo-ligase